jgi:hypothetical protein
MSRDSEEGTVDLSDSAMPAGTLHSAAFDYEKNHVEPSFRRTFLTKDGTVMTGNPQKGSFKARFRGVDLDSPLPVVTSSRTYWGTRQADGTMTFESF